MKDFLCKAKLLKFPLKECIIDDDATAFHTAASPIDRFGMTEKKAHEVKRMATHVKNMVDEIGLQQVLYFAYVAHRIAQFNLKRCGSIDLATPIHNRY